MDDERFVVVTAQQHRLLSLIEAQIRDTGVCPSFDELAAAMGVKAKSNVHRLLVALEATGHVRRVHGRKRHIEVLRPVSGLSQAEVSWCHAHAEHVRWLIGQVE